VEELISQLHGQHLISPWYTFKAKKEKSNQSWAQKRYSNETNVKQTSEYNSTTAHAK
jgi:hypothetical protein